MCLVNSQTYLYNFKINKLYFKLKLKYCILLSSRLKPRE